MPSRYPKSLRYALPLGGALVSGALGVAAYTTHALHAPRRRTWQDEFIFTPWEVQVPHERVEFAASDGVTLRGWWFPREETDHVVIACTGHRGAKHELLGIGSALWRAGNNVLLFDFRGCGDSDIAPLSLAHNELPDARAAIHFVRERLPSARVGMIGYSMGAAVSILVAADDPTVRVVVADSSFATIHDVIAHAFRRHRLPARPIVELTDLLNRWRHGYPLGAVRPVDAVGRLAPRPILIIHGGDDGITPVENAHRLFSAAGEPKEQWVVDGARHCGAYFADRQMYVERVTAFINRALSTRETYAAL